MALRLNESDIAENLVGLGIQRDDIVLVRAALGNIGRMENGASTFLNALLTTVGPRGTVVSLAFTRGAFIRRAKPADAYTQETPTYAGALPQVMLSHPGRSRSAHPQCSYVAIGQRADELTKDHGPDDGAYEPVRKLMDLGGKGLLVGCVDVSPGFTTAHLAEVDLGLHRRVIMPWLNTSYYYDMEGRLRLFRRRDPGLCSMSFRKFYPLYRKAGILRDGLVGAAPSMLVDLAAAYPIERTELGRDPQFTVCENPDCATCNARRWDRLHHLPGFVARRLARSRRRG